MNPFEKDEDTYLRQRDNVRVNRETMRKLKRQKCADCKIYYHPHCMTFDHIDRKNMKKGKSKGINQITYWNPVVFNMQIQKTSVVCLNCHRIREFKRDMDEPKFMVNNFTEKQEMIQYLDITTAGALLDQEKAKIKERIGYERKNS